MQRFVATGTAAAAAGGSRKVISLSIGAKSYAIQWNDDGAMRQIVKCKGFTLRNGEIDMDTMERMVSGQESEAILEVKNSIRRNIQRLSLVMLPRTQKKLVVTSGNKRFLTEHSAFTLPFGWRRQ